MPQLPLVKPVLVPLAMLLLPLVMLLPLPVMRPLPLATPPRKLRLLLRN